MICKQLHNVNLHARKDVVEAFKKKKAEGKIDWVGRHITLSHSSNSPPILTLMLSNGQETHTYLHTAVTKIGSSTIKIVLDNGCDATMVTKSCIQKLDLSPKCDNKTLKITTVNGQSEITSRSVTLNIYGVSIKAFVLESNLNIEPQAINLSVVWP